MLQWIIVTVVVCLSVIGASSGTFAAIAGDDYSGRLAALVNDYRTRHERTALAVDARLSSLAHEHSVAMAKAGRLSHDGLPSRVQRSGLAMCVENVGWNYPSVEAQFEGWRASPGHNQNMLNAHVERMGVGVADGYVTLLACGE